MIETYCSRSLTPQRSRLMALLVLCALAAGCGQVVKSLGEIGKLRAELLKEFSEKEININLNNDTSLTVTFVNSPLNDQNIEERAKRAQQTAAFVRKRYPSIRQLNEIWVGFVRTKTRFVVVHYSESFDFFGFDKDARPLEGRSEEPAATDSENIVRPAAIYSSELNQTEVMIEYLQIEGDFANGLSVKPRFTVPGDASGVRRSRTMPNSVSLDFTSRSDVSMFPGQSKILALSDGKVVFETSGKFSSSKSREGKLSEVLLLRIPYPAFRRLTAGEKLVFQLGDREYELSVGQRDSLRAMNEFVKE